MYIVQVDIDDGIFRLFGAVGQLQKIRVDAGLFLDIIGQKIILGLKMMIETSVGDAGFFADVFDRKRLIAFLLQDSLGSLEDPVLCFLRFLLLVG